MAEEQDQSVAAGQESVPQGKLQEGLNRTRQRAQELGQRAGESVNELRSRASAYGEGANEFLDSMSTYIKENPQRSALIAAGVGVGAGIILGMLMRNRG